MKISIGADHRGYALKQQLISHFSQYTWLDRGTASIDRCDYPCYAAAVATDVQSGATEWGVLLCGSGVGMSIAANRYRGVYAALCWNTDIARLAKEKDGSNVLVLPADFVSHDQAIAMVETWLNSRFEAGVYAHRLEMIENNTKE